MATIASEVGGERHRLAVEVAARQDLAASSANTIGLSVAAFISIASTRCDVRERVAHGAVHLRHAAQAVGVLHAPAVAVRLAQRAAGEQARRLRADGGLAGVRARRVDARVEGDVRALQRVERERADHVGAAATSRCASARRQRGDRGDRAACR